MLLGRRRRRWSPPGTGLGRQKCSKKMPRRAKERAGGRLAEAEADADANDDETKEEATSRFI